MDIKQISSRPIEDDEPDGFVYGDPPSWFGCPDEMGHIQVPGWLPFGGGIFVLEDKDK